MQLVQIIAWATPWASPPDQGSTFKVMKHVSRFKIKNQTEFPIFVMLTLEKMPLKVENIQPGKRVSD